MRSVDDIGKLKAVIVEAFPELKPSSFSLLGAGWDSIAVDVDDRLVFKFPRHEAAETALAREAGLLAVIRPAVTMPVPDLAFYPGPPPFSRHVKLRGGHLLTQDYEALPDGARQRLAADMALFYSEIHGLDTRAMEVAGALPVKPWLPPEDILRRARPVLPPGLRRYAERTVADWQRLPPDPYGTVYGFFDGHGWNMAFDHASGRLAGLYDFADSGFGPLHQEFIYSNLISRDLTARIVDAYEAVTGRILDRGRIDLLTGVLRLSELAEYADDPEHVGPMARNVADWAGC